MAPAKAKAAPPKAPRAPNERTRSATLIVNGNAVERPPPPDVPPQDVPRPDRSDRDPQGGVADVTQLLSLSEESVMQNTMVRFARDEIYTYVGSLLLAINPYKDINGLYGEEAMGRFVGRGLLNNPPHIYAIAEEAVRKARHGAGSQSLIISGESGAGKTETNKLALRYIVWRARGEGDRNAVLSRRILQANPLLETLGNAKTARNSNSSRFGKCVRLGTHPQTGELLGGVVQTYLLEKSRVISFSEQERNFHAFYQLLAGVDAAGGGGSGGGFASLELADLGLSSAAAEYALLAHSSDTTARGIDDLQGFEATVCAMGDMAISTAEARRLLGLLA